MTIIIKNFNWSQTDSKIVITVPIPRVSKSKTDIFVSSRYIKVSFEHYFFEALLFERILSDLTQCTFIDNNIIFELIKIDKIQWDCLEVSLSKQERNALKHQYIEEERENIKKKSEENRLKKAELKRVAVREQIKEDSRIRSVIETVKKAEETNALGDVHEWRTEVVKKVETIHRKPETKPRKKKILPPLRSTRSLQVIFTPREFPTPSRESKLEEETEWLEKQAKARRSAGFVSEDIRPEEKNPQFLKSKGDEFMKNHNYLGAISAYSFGITLSKNFVDLYIARSEAQLAIGNKTSHISNHSHLPSSRQLQKSRRRLQRGPNSNETRSFIKPPPKSFMHRSSRHRPTQPRPQQRSNQ